MLIIYNDRYFKNKVICIIININIQKTNEINEILINEFLCNALIENNKNNKINEGIRSNLCCGRKRRIKTRTSIKRKFRKYREGYRDKKKIGRKGCLFVFIKKGL